MSPHSCWCRADEPNCSANCARRPVRRVRYRSVLPLLLHTSSHCDIRCILEDQTERAPCLVHAVELRDGGRDRGVSRRIAPRRQRIESAAEDLHCARFSYLRIGNVRSICRRRNGAEASELSSCGEEVIWWCGVPSCKVHPACQAAGGHQKPIEKSHKFVQRHQTSHNLRLGCTKASNSQFDLAKFGAQILQQMFSRTNACNLVLLHASYVFCVQLPLLRTEYPFCGQHTRCTICGQLAISPAANQIRTHKPASFTTTSRNECHDLRRTHLLAQNHPRHSHRMPLLGRWRCVRARALELQSGSRKCSQRSAKAGTPGSTPALQHVFSTPQHGGTIILHVTLVALSIKKMHIFLCRQNLGITYGGEVNGELAA